MRDLRAFAVVWAAISGVASAQNYFPDYYSQAGNSPDRVMVDNGLSERIDPFTGKLNITQTDLVIPGNGGMDLAIIRSYTNREDSVVNTLEKSVVGLDWRLHFGRMFWVDQTGCDNQLLTSSDNPVFETQDGARQMFMSTGGNELQSRERWRLVCLGIGNYQVYNTQGTRFDATLKVGDVTYVTRITDRNGNWIQINYSTSNPATPYITSVTTSDGRSLTFNYLSQTSASIRLSSISGHGRTWNYSYNVVSGTSNVHYHLTSVQRPDSRSWGYQYNTTSIADGKRSLKQLTHPYGGVITYTYDNESFDNTSLTYTVVKQKTTGASTNTASGTWSFGYAYNSTEDTTTVDFPGGRYVYKHFGVSSTSSGSVWKIGLLKSREVRSSSGQILETTTHTWGSQQISNEPFARAPRTMLNDSVSYAPILTQRVINRYGTNFTETYSNHDTYGNARNIVESGPHNNRTITRNFTNNTTKWILGLNTSETIAGIGTISRGFDSDGNMQFEDTFGRRYNFTYTGAGDLSTIRDPLNNTTTYSSYFRGIARTIARPESVSLSRVVSSAGDITSATNGRGKITLFTHDGLGRVTSVNPPAGATTNISHGSSRNTTRSGYSRVELLNGFGEVVRITEEGIVTNRNRDALGRTTYESYRGRSVGTTFTYNALNQVTRELHGDGTDTDYTYLANNEVRVTNERGFQTTYRYQSFGDPNRRALIRVTAPLTQTTTISIAMTSI